jgi:pimeloyl-ACP methyl ester carboxylesterase
MNTSIAERLFFTHRGLRLSYLDSAPGDAQRPLVVLLHGFPDEALMWQPQIAALHAEGFRVLAQDTVGCGQSDMAPRRRDYDARTVAADSVALLDHLGIASAQFVGHDWGAVLAWYVAIYFPQRVRKLVVLSVGHPTAYGRAGWKQKLLGWYTIYFQFVGLAEWLLMRRGPLGLRYWLRSHPHIDAVMQRIRAPGRLTAAVRLYRANLASILFKIHADVRVPTLGVWSEKDNFLTEEQMTASAQRVRGSWQYQRLSGGHWMSLGQPGRINQILLDYLEL